MKAIERLAIVGVLVLATVASLHSQQPAPTQQYQLINRIKVPIAGRAEFLELVKNNSLKVAAARVKAGEIVSWTLLRSVMPAGSEARSDFLISTISRDAPAEPLELSGLEAQYKSAGTMLTYGEFVTQRSRLSSLVSTELWRPVARIGTLKKGDYMFINYMKVKDEQAYLDFEQTVWRPMAEQLVKDGTLSGWMVATKELPGGTDTPYSYYTVDMFPSWAAVFKNWSARDTFAKVHPEKNFDAAVVDIGKLRSLAARELWVVVERVSK